jgi:hypothetical protein
MKKPTRTAPNRPDRVKVAPAVRAELKDRRRAGWTLTVGGRHPMLTCPAGHHAIPVPQADGGVVNAFRRDLRHHDAACP